VRWHRKIKKTKKNPSPIAQLPSLGDPTQSTLKIKQVRSSIGYPKNQGATLKCLGLTKIGQVVECSDTPTTHGMLRTVQHLIQILPE
jgi:large subunit ribosomal protein L30